MEENNEPSKRRRVTEEKEVEPPSVAALTPPQPPPSPSPPPDTKAPTYSTDYYRTLGLATCSKCGSKRITDGGKPICALAKSDCPFLNK